MDPHAAMPEAAAVAARRSVIGDFTSVYDVPKPAPPSSIWVAGARLGVMRGPSEPGKVRLLLCPGDAHFGLSLSAAHARALGEALIAQADAIQAGAV